MNSLIWLVYLIDIIGSLNIIVVFILIASLITIGICSLIYAINIEYDGRTDPSYAENVQALKMTRYCLPKLFTIFVISLILIVFSPSKKTMILMSGLYIGNTVVTEVKNSPLYNKAYKLAEQKLDELLLEQKSN